MPFDPSNPSPIASVGILTRNAGTLFTQVIDALEKQRTAWPFEIVILDSGSKDGTDAVAAGRGVRVVPYKPAKFRFGTARDTLFENCRGQVIVAISQDVVAGDERWLEKLIAPILDGRADATCGEQVAPPGVYAFYWDYHGSWMRSVAIEFDKAHGGFCLSGSNMALRRSTWQQYRFGDVEAIEDRGMQVKLFSNGHAMMQVKNAVSLHGHDYTWKQLTDRVGSFAMGWAELGWPYTFGRMVRDLLQPSRYIQTLGAFFTRQLRSWKELVFPFAMCWIQYSWSRRGLARRAAQSPVPLSPAPTSSPNVAPPSAPEIASQKMNRQTHGPQRLAS